MPERPKTTLFMLSSLDGKISSGDTDNLDVDRDWKKIKGVKEGLPQYYELEQKTDLVSFNTGRVMAKVGMNTRKLAKEKIPVRFVLVDSKPHLTESGVRYLSSWLQHVYIVTTNRRHPAVKLSGELENVTVIHFAKKIDFKKLFSLLYSDHGIKRMTIQSGGTMNALLLRAGLIDRISLVIAPLMVGGSTTSSLMDGEALHEVKDLKKLVVLQLQKVEKLKKSFLHLTYKVVNRK